ncbi:hypothetical protein Poli38472_002492 [Pythium oligandrum]|uniref:UBA domain-containing protein n=1 Tax=Pythium oligandrum TaxID=41045 RepID=A0A8K1CIU3_PYTOL|nr:hypothetical protein Poli38472_002492 [Pythium oligandrum]|eukprot:TMW63551.1 hypothetical protein Poli38472_002492 [Pythium oligandrum]
MEQSEVYFGDDFGQKIDLTVRIREILRNYPEGTSIFKEMVQNADDAGATEVQFCLDHRQHASDNLAYRKLESFQGPSLLVFNNATFTDADFQSIQRIGDSLKKDTSKGWKTGRFGVGFNSVYHLTDLPAFVSGSNMVFFDPQACHLPNVNPSNPGKMINFASHPELVASFPDQFNPFRAFGCDFSRPFDGTIFRLALRSEGQAERSRLSNRAQTPSHVSEMLGEFAESLHLVLLFLRNVSCIKVLHWDDGATEPRLLCEARIDNLTDTLRIQRSLRDSILHSDHQGQRQFATDGVRCDYSLDIKITQPTGSSSSEHYFVSNQLGGGECSRIANDPANASQRLVPWGGVAVHVPSDDKELSCDGLAFCFLPLPTHTYLPVHVNGYFELSSNRRDVWFGEGLSGDGLLRARWNIALLRDVIAPCYARTLARLADQSIMNPKHHASLFPQAIPPAPWDQLAISFLQLIKSEPCLYSEAEGGAWTCPIDSMILKRSTPNYSNLAEWLLEDDVRLVRYLSEEAENVLVKSQTVPRFMEPSMLRTVYKKHTSRHAGKKHVVRAILDFVVKDLDVENVASLVNVKLLPIADGTIGVFQKPAGADADAIEHLSAMGFSRSQCIQALHFVGSHDVEGALNWLLSHPNPAAIANESSSELTTFFVPSVEENALLKGAQPRLVDIEALPSNAQKLVSSAEAARYLNVRSLDMEGFGDLLAMVFPADWFGKMTVPWTGHEGSHLDEAWFRQLWHYLGSSSELSLLQDKWPIVPTSSGVLCALNSSAGVLSPELIPAMCLSALAKLKIPVLLQNLFATIQPSQDVWRYIHQPTAAGVLSALAKLGGCTQTTVKAYFKDVTVTEREEMKQFLLSGFIEDFEDAQRKIIRLLPIFEGVCATSSVKDEDLTWIEDSEVSSDSGVSPVFDGLETAGGRLKKVCPGIGWELLDDQFVHARETEKATIRALARLGVEKISKVTFFSEYLIPRFHSVAQEARVDFISQLLRELTSLLAEDVDGVLARIIDTLPIFPSMSGDLKRIVDLYDPEVPEFEKMMDGTFFPAAELQEPQPLAVLRSLGLQRTLSRRSILSIAISVESDQADISKSNRADADFEEKRELLQQRSTEVFRYLDSHIEQLLTASTPQQTASRRNIKVKGMKLLRSFLGDDRESSAGQHGFSVSAEENERLAHERDEIDDFKAKLAVIAWVPVSKKKPHASFPWYREEEDILVASPDRVRLPRDLALCSSEFHILPSTAISETLRHLFGWNKPIPVEVVASQMKAIAMKAGDSDRLEAQNIWPVVFDIYKILSRFFEAEPSEERRKSVLALLDGEFPYIWVGGRFVAPHQVALSTLVNAEPYLFAVPNELVHFRPFLKAIGVRERFSLGDYVHVLSVMYDKSQQPLEADEGQRLKLSQDELVTAIGLIQLISDILPHHSDYELYAPDINGVLSRTVNLTYDDAPWLDKRDVDLGSLRFIHPKISNEVASKIGGQSLRSLLLHANQSESLVFSTAGDVEAFGQTEALTKRISHILEQYPDGPHIISELIQNADDAGATRVRLLYSGVTYGMSSLLSPAMAKWQGPALYAYNDAEFKESDFISLARIGQGAKLQKVATTGRFGLGFNSVYHFTDVPSIVSANSLVIFDPHATNLPGITPANPGIKIRFVNSNLPKQFPDQFEPYKLFGCDLERHFHGTLFRFPLRHEAIASGSEIKQRAYSRREIVDLFESFRSSVTAAMLFLRNVRSVEIYIQLDREESPSLLYGCEIPEEDRGESWRAIDRFMAERSAGRSEVTTKRAFYSRLARTPENELPSVTQTVHLKTKELKQLHDTFARIREQANDGASVHDGQSELVESTEKYLVCNQLGGGRARDMACATENESLKLIPWVGVAGRIDNYQVEGRAFCFLPLPVRTGLSVHINGYFELSSNRRDIWHGDDLSGDGKLRSLWNSHLLTDAVAPAYVAFILEAAERFGEQSLAFFPSALPAEPWQHAVETFFALVRDKNVLVTSSTSQNPGKRIAPASCVLIDDTVPGWETLEKSLNKVSIETALVPSSLRGLLSQFNVVYGTFTPTFFRKLVRYGRFLSALEPEAAQHVIQFCLSDIRQPDTYKELDGLPIVPVRDGTYRSITIMDSQSSVNRESLLYFTNDSEAELLVNFPSRLVSENFRQVFDQIPNLVASSNLRVMNVSALIDHFLPEVLPTHWAVANEVVWEPSVQRQHPTEEWVKRWWQYLDCNIRSIGDPADFTKWPLLPVSYDGKYRRLVRPSAPSSIVVSHADFPLSLDMLVVLPPVLRKIGIATVNVSLVEGKEVIDWMIDHQFLVKLSLDGVLSALRERLTNDEAMLARTFEHLSTREKQTLVEFVTLHSLSTIGEDNLVLMRRLPVFAVFCDEHSDTEISNHRSIDSGAFIASEDADARLLDENFFIVSSGNVRTFLRESGAEEWSYARVLADHVFPKLPKLYNRDETLMDTVISDALMSFSLHQRSNPRFREAIGKYPLVPSRRGMLRKIDDLYDPNNKDLSELVGPNSLPSLSFSTGERVGVLRGFGLRSTLSCHAIVESARSVESLSTNTATAADGWAKAHSLLKIVNRSFDDMASSYTEEEGNQPQRQEELEVIVDGMRTINWLPVHASPVKRFMPWKMTESNEERPYRLSSAERTRPESDAWMCSASRDVLSGQLQSEVLIAAFGWDKPVDPVDVATQLNKVGHDPELREAALENASSPDVKTLVHEVQRMYQVLDDLRAGDEEQFTQCREYLEEASWVWTGRTFVSMRQIAVDSDSELEPLLFAAPPDLVIPRSLLEAFDLKPAFSPVDYVVALKTLPSGVTLTASEQKTCVKLFSLLASAIAAGDGSSTIPRERLVLLDENNRLSPARVLTYDDMEWNESSEARRGHKFVSKAVPREVALALGAASFHSKLAETSVSSTQVTCPSVEALMPILPKPSTWYHTLFTEMLLAAERFGGTEIDFFVDHRKHPTQRVIQPSFQALQEEAVCVHIHGVVLSTNDVNSLFGGEMSRPGFLSGFFFSDCLQILSGDGFYILDPTNAFLGSSTNSTKGTARRYDILSEDFMRYPDQLLPFCTLPSCPSNVGSGTRSTLLRFPWRKEKSGLSSYALDTKKVERFISFLKTQLRECLLFTESVHRVSVWSVGKESEFAVHCHGEAALDVPEYTLKRRNETRNSNEWKKKFSFHSFFKNPVIPETQMEFVVNLDIENKLHKDTWLLSDNIGTGRSRDLASSPVHEVLNSIPYVSVAVHLFRDGNPAPPVRGRLFKIVSTSQSIGLPIHVNGCFKKHLRETSLAIQPPRSEMNDETSIKAHWNRVLIEDGVVDAYLKLMLVAKRRYESTVPKAFYRIWPALAEKGNAVGSMIQSVLYRQIGSNEFFLCTDGTFRSLNSGYVVDMAGMDLQVVSFAQLHFPSFDIPTDVLTDCSRLLPSRVHSLTPKTMRRFLKNMRLSDVHSGVCLPLLEYCLSDLTFPLPPDNHPMWLEFQNLPLLPLEDGTVGMLGSVSRGRYILGTFNQVELLRPLSRMFVSLEARHRLQAYFSDGRFVSQMGLSHFSIKVLADHIDRVLPSRWKNQVIVQWNPTSADEIDRVWLYRFWHEVRFERRSLAYFNVWPLVPIQGSRLLSCAKPDAALCVWSGSIDRDLRAQLTAVFQDAATATDERLAEADQERRKLKELAASKLHKDDSHDSQRDEDVDYSGDLELGDVDSDNESDVGEAASGDANTENSEQGTTSSAGHAEDDVGRTNEDEHLAHQTEVHNGDTIGAIQGTIESGASSVDVAVEATETDQGPDPEPSSPVVDVEYTSREALHTLLVRLNVSMVELAYLQGQENEVIPSARDVTISVLDSVCASDANSLQWMNLAESDATLLAEFFSYHGQRHGGYNRMYIDMLKKLPIYVNICNVPCALDHGEHFLVPPEIDLTSIPLPPNARQRFMKVNSQLTAFYKELGVEEMSYAKLLVFLLPFYDHLASEQRSTVLQLIKERWQTLRGDAQLVGVLRSTPLFADEDGSYRTADSFYDPRNKVLRAIYQDEPHAFPAGQFDRAEWLELMSEIGLRSDITVDLFIECAQRLEALFANKSALDPADEVVINTFHQYFVQNFEKYDRSRVFFEKVSQIAFVPTVVYEDAVSMSATPSVMVTRTVLRKYGECATPGDQALVFSVLPVLMATALPPRVLWSRLGLQSPPEKSIVLQHLYNIVGDASGSILERWHFFQSITEVFQEMFKFLQNSWDQLSADERAKLGLSPIVPVGSALVKGSRLFFHLPENLAPLMFEVPRAFGAYDALFRHLGCKDSPSVQDYVLLLRDLHAECQGHCLNLNELLAVTRIVGMLASSLTESSQTLSADALQNLYLPSTVSEMRQVHQMAYNDAPWICERVDLSQLHVVHPRISAKRCEIMGVKGLSKVVKEVLDSSNLQVCADDNEIERFNAILSSQQFGSGLRTIITAQQQKGSGNDQVGLQADFDQLSRRIAELTTYRVVAVETLRSSFIAQLGHPPRQVDVTKASAATGSVSYVAEGSRVIYVAVKTLQLHRGIRKSQVVASSIDQVLGGVIQDCAMLESILCCDVMEIEPLLRFMNIHEDPALIVEKLRGAYGEVLADTDRALVELSPLRTFYVGELVAIDVDGELRYGKIVDLDTTNVSISNFSVRISRTVTRWYPSTQIYSFRSSRDHAPSQASSEHNASFVERITSQPRAHGDAASRDLPPSVAIADAPSVVSQSASASPMTIVSAVNDLLSRLNLSLDSSYEELIAENLRLQRRLEQAEESRRLAMAQIDDAIREKKDAQDSLICAICLENNVDRVLIPCGHIYCSGCVSRLPRQTCPICRENIASTSLFHVPS